MALQDFTGHSASLPVDGLNKHFIVKSTVDCSKSVADGGFGTLLSTDTARVLELKEGWFVVRVWVRLVKIGTVGATILTQIGDTVGGDVWIATDMNIGTTGTINQVKGSLHTDTNGALNGYLYLADNYLLLAISTANFDGTLEFAAEVIDVFGGNTIV
jgi:hypothetical protein